MQGDGGGDSAPPRTPLGRQVRTCEQRWAHDAYMVAEGESDPVTVSLVGIGGLPRNAMFLYADMCALGYGTAGIESDMSKAQEWWVKASDEGHRLAGGRLQNGVYDSMLHMDPTNDRQPEDGWLDDAVGAGAAKALAKCAWQAARETGTGWELAEKAEC